MHLAKQDPNLNKTLPKSSILAAEVVWAVKHEMARTVEDFLSRRTRSLLLDARTSMAMAPRVADVMAAELGHDAAWQEAQVQAYTDLARKYVMVPS